MKLIHSIMVFSLISGMIFGSEPEPEFKPAFKGVTLTSKVQRRTDGAYVYDYTLVNPPDNTQGVLAVKINLGYSFANDKPEVNNSNLGWINGVSPNSFPEEQTAIQWSVTQSSADQTKPGKTISGLQVVALEPPQMCYARVAPDFEAYITGWMEQQHRTRGRAPYAECGNKDHGCMEDRAVLRYSYGNTIPAVLCPNGAVPGTYRHWGGVPIEDAWYKGWIKDRKLYDIVHQNFSDAYKAALAQDRETVHRKLRIVIDAIQSSTPEQRTEEAYSLINLNAIYLNQTEPYPCSPRLWIADFRDRRPIASLFTFPITLYNQGEKVAGSELIFEVIKGPNAGLTLTVRTNQDGAAYFRYSSKTAGTDQFVVHAPFSAATLRLRESDPGFRPGEKQVFQSSAASPGCRELKDLYSETKSVEWGGWTLENVHQEGPDLTLSGIVPMIISKPGEPVFMGDTTKNSGTRAAPATVTRYFISASPDVKPESRIMLGQRVVPPLGPEEKNYVPQRQFTIPASLPAGNYYLIACADTEGTVKESDESNNCSSQDAFGFAPAAARQK